MNSNLQIIFAFVKIIEISMQRIHINITYKQNLKHIFRFKMHKIFSVNTTLHKHKMTVVSELMARYATLFKHHSQMLLSCDKNFYQA